MLPPFVRLPRGAAPHRGPRTATGGRTRMLLRVRVSMAEAHCIALLQFRIGAGQRRAAAGAAAYPAVGVTSRAAAARPCSESWLSASRGLICQLCGRTAI